MDIKLTPRRGIYKTLRKRVKDDLNSVIPRFRIESYLLLTLTFLYLDSRSRGSYLNISN